MPEQPEQNTATARWQQHVRAPRACWSRPEPGRLTCRGPLSRWGTSRGRRGNPPLAHLPSVCGGRSHPAALCTFRSSRGAEPPTLRACMPAGDVGTERVHMESRA
jgi:hypothetical protein